MHARVVGTRALPAFSRAEDVGKGVVDRGWKCERSPIRCWHVGVVLECTVRRFQRVRRAADRAAHIE